MQTVEKLIAQKIKTYPMNSEKTLNQKLIEICEDFVKHVGHTLKNKISFVKTIHKNKVNFWLNDNAIFSIYLNDYDDANKLKTILHDLLLQNFEKFYPYIDSVKCKSHEN